MRVLFGLLCASSGLLSAQETAPQLERDVIPILTERCIACHSGAKASGGLDLATAETLLKGSLKGPVVVKGASERSPLFQRVSNHSMPPPGAGKALSAELIRTIQRWIDLGAPGGSPQSQEIQSQAVGTPEITDKDRQFWSFRPPIRPSVPKVKDSGSVRTPIDAFVLAKLQAKDLGLAPEAAKRTLLRRVYFDLIGLPPSPEEVRAFLADAKPNAYERLIDRLLDSPHYGERWGRHWLDAAGYSDTKGLDNDAAERFLSLNDGIWRYRDYVVRSFNQDKPYDQFLTEQLAGDELVDWRKAAKFTPEILDSLVATGYLRHVTYRNGHDALFQTIETLSSGVLGLTVNCARCHNHKYDPIPQRDYYRLMAVFAPALMAPAKSEPKEDYLPDISRPELAEIEKYNSELDKSIAPLQKQLDELRRPPEERLLAGKLSILPDVLRADVRKALETAPDKRDAAQKYLAGKLEKLVKVDPKEVLDALSEKDRAIYEKLQGHIDTLKRWRRSYRKIQVAWESAPPAPVHLLFRGDPKTPGPVVEPGVLTVLARSGQSGVEKPAWMAGESSGRRLALAKWLTRPDHPLTARVIVNRVWQHYFGKGIVSTPENFGRTGAAPTHPELLDWLAVDFVENGWRFKRLHRMILTSSVIGRIRSIPGPKRSILATSCWDASISAGWKPKFCETAFWRSAVNSTGNLGGRLRHWKSGPRA